jgi:hypothetical protein
MQNPIVIPESPEGWRLTVTLGPWTEAPASNGVHARWRMVARFSDLMGHFMGHYHMVIQVERRRSATAESSYTSQILIGGLVYYAHNAAVLDHESPTPHHLWCSKCYADSPDPAAAGTGGVRIPHWMKGRYFASVPDCTTCKSPVYFYDSGMALPYTAAYLFESLINPPLQKWVEEKLALASIYAGSCTRQPGPAATAEFRDELLAIAFSPERIGPLEAAHGRAAVRELLS